MKGTVFKNNLPGVGLRTTMQASLWIMDQTNIEDERNQQGGVSTKQIMYGDDELHYAHFKNEKKLWKEDLV